MLVGWVVGLVGEECVSGSGPKISIFIIAQ